MTVPLVCTSRLADFNNASLPRYPKASAQWYADYAARHPYDSAAVAPHVDADDEADVAYGADVEDDEGEGEGEVDGDDAAPLEGESPEDEVDRTPLLRSLAVFGLLAVLCALVIDAFVTRGISMLVTGRYHSAYGSINDTSDVEIPSTQP
jgi:hypothetical protein